MAARYHFQFSLPVSGTDRWTLNGETPEGTDYVRGGYISHNERSGVPPLHVRCTAQTCLC